MQYPTERKRAVVMNFFSPDSAVPTAPGGVIFSLERLISSFEIICVSHLSDYLESYSKKQRENAR